MKKFLLTLLISAFAVFGLTGCSTSATPKETVTETETEIAIPDEPIYTEEDEYLADVHSVGNTYIENITDSDLLDLGYLVCEALDSGNTTDDLAYELASSGNYDDYESQQYAASIIAGAVVNLCPEYNYQLS